MARPQPPAGDGCPCICLQPYGVGAGPRGFGQVPGQNGLGLKFGGVSQQVALEFGALAEQLPFRVGKLNFR